VFKTFTLLFVIFFDDDDENQKTNLYDLPKQGLNASNNLITTLNPLKFLLELENLIVSSNKLCNLFEVDSLSLQRERKNPEIKKIMNEEQSKKIREKGEWPPLPPGLKHLDVSHNAHLCSLQGLEHLPLLETLDCSSCHIPRLEQDLGLLKNLSSLIMRNNNIATLSDVTTVFPTIPSLTNIDLTGNEFVSRDEEEGKGIYYLAMLELGQGRLKKLDNRNILEKDYKRYDSLKSEIQCEELVANLNVECTENTIKMDAMLNNVASRHRLQEEVLREAIRSATLAEQKKFGEYTTFVNEKLRELKIREKMSSESVDEIQQSLQQMKEIAPVYVQAQSPPTTTITLTPEQQQSQEAQEALTDASSVAVPPSGDL
jgi:hypothetical protein